MREPYCVSEMEPLRHELELSTGILNVLRAFLLISIDSKRENRFEN